MMIGPHSIRSSRLALSVVLAAATLLVAPLAHAQDHGAHHHHVPQKLWVDQSAHAGIDRNAPLRFSSLSNLAEKLSPSVVNIIVTYGNDDEIQRLLGKEDISGPTAMAQGTGFIIHPDGYILTNNHVVEGASKIKIKLLDNTEYEGHVVGLDPQIDVALVKIDSKRKLPAIGLGDSDKVRVGEHVIAIGNPLGLSHTVTTGIISALGRRDLGIEDDAYSDFIQTDASINPGNSGGPLIGLGGEVIGINTAINRNGQGIGFAIPINMVKKLLPQLAQNGYVTRSWLGIRVQQLDGKLAKTFGLSRPTGALVTEVIDNSPASKGGIHSGDVILTFDGTQLKNSDQLPWLSSTAGVGRTVDVELLRHKKRQTLHVKMEELPNQEHPKIPTASSVAPKRPTNADFGVRVKALTASLARQLGAADTNGVVVTSVDQQTPAKGAGLRQRDVITEVGDAKVTDSKDFDKALGHFATGDIVRLKVVRGGRVVYIAVEK